MRICDKRSDCCEDEQAIRRFLRALRWRAGSCVYEAETLHNVVYWEAATRKPDLIILDSACRTATESILFATCVRWAQYRMIVAFPPAAKKAIRLPRLTWS